MNKAVKAWKYLVVGLVLLCLSVCVSCAGGSMTREEFRNKIVRGKVLKSEFIKTMGKPDKTSVIGDNAFWDYRCKDGVIQLVLSQGWMENQGVVWVQSINEF